MKLQLIALLAAALAASACSDSDLPFVCDIGSEPAIVVNVVDSVSNTPIRSTSIRGIATSTSSGDAYADTATTIAGDGVSFTPLWLALNHPGTFNVTVDMPGYRTWTANHVVVAKGEHGCGVTPVELTARMRGNE